MAQELSKDERKKAKKLRKEEKKERKRRRRSSDSNCAEESHKSSTSCETNDLSTPFRRKRLHMKVSLLPQSLSNVYESIQQRISSLLLKYDDGVGGVLLTFSNISHSDSASSTDIPVGKIWNESPYIHYEVEADALVFEPSPGMKLTGVVNESHPSHVGMLVRSFFNAMIPSHVLQLSGYQYDYDQKEWYFEKDDVTSIGIDSVVPFEVEKIHSCGGVMAIEGNLKVLVANSS